MQGASLAGGAAVPGFRVTGWHGHVLACPLRCPPCFRLPRALRIGPGVSLAIVPGASKAGKAALAGETSFTAWPCYIGTHATGAGHARRASQADASHKKTLTGMFRSRYPGDRSRTIHAIGPRPLCGVLAHWLRRFARSRIAGTFPPRTHSCRACHVHRPPTVGSLALRFDGLGSPLGSRVCWRGSSRRRRSRRGAQGWASSRL